MEPGPLAVRLDLTLGLDGSAAERMARWKALRFVELGGLSSGAQRASMNSFCGPYLFHNCTP